MQRRTFIAGGVAAAVAATMPHFDLGLSAEEKPVPSDPQVPDLEVIDCHTHFYDPTRAEGVPWPDKGSPLDRPVFPKHLREQKPFRPLTGTVVVEASDWVADNAWILDLAANEPFIVGFVGRLYPGEQGFAEHLKRFAANPLYRGIRVLEGQVREALKSDKLDDYRRLADADLSLDVNGPPTMPALVAELAKRIPNLRIVVNHIGNVRIDANEPPREWTENIRAAAAHPNVYCKISGLVEGAAQDGKPAPKDLEFYRPYVDVVWNAFGEDRVIYGSNWPVCEVGADYETTQRLSLSYAMEKGDHATRKFCSENAKRVYKWIDREGRNLG